MRAALLPIGLPIPILIVLPVAMSMSIFGPYARPYAGPCAARLCAHPRADTPARTCVLSLPLRPQIAQLVARKT